MSSKANRKLICMAKNSTGGDGRFSRRTFAKTAAAAMIVPRHVLGGVGYQAPSETLAIAAVGIGGMGKNYLKGCEHERIVALCDCDAKYAEPVFARYPDAKRYRDFRELFEKEANNFDALIVGTPDHTHAVIVLAALKLGKHIYCAKPLTHNIHEARRVREAVLKAGVITQTSSRARRARGLAVPRRSCARECSVRFARCMCGRRTRSTPARSKGRRRRPPFPRAWTGTSGWDRLPIAPIIRPMSRSNVRVVGLRFRYGR